MNSLTGSITRDHHSRNGRYEVRKMRVLKNKHRCKNAQVKECGYYIGKATIAAKGFSIRFEARRDWNDDSTMIAHLDTDRGECMSLKTHTDYQGCGIGRALMILCLGHDDITEDGGMDPSTFRDFRHFGLFGQAVWGDIGFSTSARELCKTLVAIICEPVSPTTKYACKAYIEAAKIKGYQMMFVDKVSVAYLPGEHYQVLKTKDAEREFNRNPDNFVESKGGEWFFCKCARGTTKDCLELERHANWYEA